VECRIIFRAKPKRSQFVIEPSTVRRRRAKPEELPPAGTAHADTGDGRCREHTASPENNVERSVNAHRADADRILNKCSIKRLIMMAPGHMLVPKHTRSRLSARSEKISQVAKEHSL